MNPGDARPGVVTLACVISIGLTASELAWLFLDDVGQGDQIDVSILLGLAVVLGLPLLFAPPAFFRRNWGRIGLIVCAAVGVLSVPLVLVLDGTSSLLESAASALANLLYLVAQVLIVVLLLLPQSTRWYRPSPMVQA